MMYRTMVGVGLVLVVWATSLNPKGAASSPDDPPGRVVTTGPYRWLRHPIYVGQWLVIAGLGGWASGLAGCLCAGYLAELLFSDWTTRERRAQK